MEKYEEEEEFSDLNQEDETLYFAFPLSAILEQRDEEAFNLLIEDPRFVVTKEDIDDLSRLKSGLSKKQKAILYSHPNYRENSRIEYKPIKVFGHTIEIGHTFVDNSK